MYVIDLGDLNAKSPQWWTNFAREFFDNKAMLMTDWSREFNKILKKHRGKFEVDWAKQRKLLRFKSEEDALLFMVRWS